MRTLRAVKCTLGLLKLVISCLLVLLSIIMMLPHHNYVAALSGVAQTQPYIRLTQHNNHANISELLDNLLRGYDNSIRPDFGGPPAIVEVDIMVRSMGPISEVDMVKIK